MRPPRKVGVLRIVNTPDCTSYAGTYLRMPDLAGGTPSRLITKDIKGEGRRCRFVRVETPGIFESCTCITRLVPPVVRLAYRLPEAMMDIGF